MQGPSAMRASQLGYNDALKLSEQRELLLNLVRMRYLEAPEFLSVSGISTQMTFEAGAAIAGETGGSVSLVKPDVKATYSERPTLSFTPQRDQDFTRQLMTPIDLDTVYLLTNYGWGIDRVLRILARGINGRKNNIAQERPKVMEQQSLQQFARAAAILGRLETRGAIKIVAETRSEALSAALPINQIKPSDVLSATKEGYLFEYRKNPPSYVLLGDITHYVLQVSEEAWRDNEFVEAARILGLTPGQSAYEIEPDAIEVAAANDELQIETQSVLSALAYLSSAVSVPDAHIKKQLARVSKRGEMLNDLLKIHVARTPFEDAYLSVPYRGYWFYTDDKDLATKRTLGLLTALFRLTFTAASEPNTPILTLPVGQ